MHMGLQPLQAHLQDFLWIPKYVKKKRYFMPSKNPNLHTLTLWVFMRVWTMMEIILGSFLEDPFRIVSRYLSLSHKIFFFLLDQLFWALKELAQHRPHLGLLLSSNIALNKPWFLIIYEDETVRVTRKTNSVLLN